MPTICAASISVYQYTAGQDRLVGYVRIIGDADRPGHMADTLRGLVPCAELEAAPLLPCIGLSFKQAGPDLTLESALEVGRMMTDAHHAKTVENNNQ